MTVIVSPLKLADVVRYSFGFVKAVIQRPQLNLAIENYMSYESDFVIPAATFLEWQKAIGNRDLADNRNTFYAYLNSRAFFTCAEKIGVDFKTVMHLASSIDYRDASFQFVPEKRYTYQARVADVKAFPGVGRGILDIEIKIYDGKDLKIIHTDHMFFRGIDQLSYQKLVAKQKPNDKFSGISRRLSELKDNHEFKTSFNVGKRLGVEYGMLSGDLNPIHTMNIVSKLFKHKGSFIQGLCTTNLVLSLIQDAKGADVGKIDINFANPLFCGSNYELMIDQNHFEVVDAEGQLKVFGTFDDCGHLKRLMKRGN